MEGSIISTINSNTLTLKKGDCMLISPNMVHNLMDNGDVYFFIGVFSADFVHSFAKKENYSQFYKFVPEKEVMDYLLKYMIYTGTPDLYMLKSCLYSICDQVSKHSETHLTTDVNQNFIMAVNTYISEHLTDSFSRKDIASALNYEEHYFSTLFHKNFFMGFNNYVNLFRIEHACDLLIHTKMNIADIAFECGYSNIRSFNRVFKALCEKTPNQYRKSKTSITELNIKPPETIIYQDA